MNTNRLRIIRAICPWYCVLLVLCGGVLSASAQRQMERLGRGVIAMHTTTTQVYVSWRLLGNDPSDIGFNLYRSANGGGATKINGVPLTNTTDYIDTPPNLTTTAYTYSVKPVLNGVEVPDTWANPLAPNATLPANSPVQAAPYLRIPLQPTPDGALDVKFCWVGDLDGDGEYDFVVDRQPAGDARQFLEAYKRDGTMLWRMDLGFNSTNHYNIEPGSSSVSIGHGDNVTVYDLDGDGKAEVILRTANGVTFGDGTPLNAPNNTVQYLSILNGMTGTELARATLPNLHFSDGPMNGHMGVFYPDGQRPSVLWAAKNRAADNSFHGNMTVWDYRNGQLTQRFFYTSDTNGDYTPEAHQIRLGDPDNDGKDEFVDIGFTLDDNGTLLFSVRDAIHGDRFHMGDLDPDRPGLESFIIQQNNPSGLATAYYEAATGKLIKKWYAGSVVDVGRGDATDFDPASKGSELVSTQPGIFDSKGNQLYANSFFPAEAIWWDADLSREFLQANETVRVSKVNNGALGYFDLIDKNTDAPGGHLAYGGRPAFWGDILGDWREEIICVENGNTALRIYTTKYAATNRLYTLMHNPQYRIEATTKGYVQASMVDYYLGTGMTPPQPPPMVDAKLVWRGGPGATTWDIGTTASWTQNGTNTVYTDGDSVRFDISGNATTTVALNGTLSPGAVTVYSPKDYTFDAGGSLAGTMKLMKAGKGMLTLQGTNSFTGQTTVWDGALMVNGDLQQSPVTVWGGAWGGPLAAGQTGGRIGGSGQFSQPVTVKYRGAITPGAGMNAPGTLTFGNNLTMEDGTTFALDISDDATGLTKTNDLIVVTGNLTLQGTNTFFIRKLNATLPPGTYPLVNYSGSLIGNLNSVKIAGLEGIPATLSNPPGQIVLVVKSVRSASTLTWTGGQSGNAWNLATSSNWLNGVTRDIFVPQDSVRFDNTGSSNLTVTLSDSLLTTDVVVDSTANYTFAGAGAIIGPGGLVKSNTGTLTITAINNNYSGRTLIAGGTVVVSELDAIGFPSPLGNQVNSSPTNLVLSGSSTLRVTGESYTDRGMTLNAGTNSIDVNNAANQVTVAGPVVGSGVLQKVGPGLLALTASNSYSGGTIIQGGSIVLGGVNGAGNRYGVGTGPITFINGTLSLLDLQNSYTYPHTFIVPAGNVGRIDCDGRSVMTGSLTGGGTFTVMTPFVRTDFNANWSAFTGQLNVISDSDGGSFRVNNSAGFPNAKVNVGSLVSFQNRVAGTPTISIGELSGSIGGDLSGGTGSDGLAVNWSVGGLNTSATLACSTYANIGLIKVGTGTWTLSGTNLSHTGQTTVNGGTMLINGNATNATGAVTVGASGTLGGTGIVGGNTTVNGKLAPGATGIGTLKFRGNVTFSASGSAIMEIQKSNATKDLADVGGTITYGGTLVVTNLAGTLANGDSFKIFNAAVYAGSFANYSLPPLNAGLAWNTTSLNVNGTLSVVIDNSSTTPPDAPLSLVATPVSSSQINLSWADSSTNETNFLIERSLNNASFSQVGTVNSGVTTFPDSGLSANTLYYYRVRATNNIGPSAYSPVASATTLAVSAAPGEVVKANNANNLNLDTSWTNGVAPTANDVAVWNSIVTAANTTSLGADTNWAGIRIANPAGAVTINYGNVLTLGAAGIDMSAASQNLTLSNNVALAAAQTWNVASNKTLTVAGMFTAGLGKSLTKTGLGVLAVSTNIITAAAAPDGLTVNQGTLRLSGTGSTVQVRLNGGTYDVGALQNTPVDVGDAGGTLVVSANRTLSGAVTGSNILNLVLTAQLSFGSDMLSSFTGAFIVSGTSGIRINSSSFTGGDNVSFDLGNGPGFMNRNASAATVALGSLTGGPNTSLGVSTASVTWSIGGKNLDSTFAGTISGAATLVKIGTGTLTLSGTNSYTGTTTISGGTLQIGSGGTAGLLGTNNVVNNAALAFNRADTITDAGVISGTGSLAQFGNGMLVLSNVHTYTGSTIIGSGTLALINNGSIANSTNVNISLDALFDVSGRTGGGLTLASGQTLSGNGTVRGNLTVGSGAKLIPGSGVGALTFSNSLVLLAGSVTTMEISAAPVAHDQIKVMGNLAFGGTLVVTNIGAGPLAAGNSFVLFDAPTPSGYFSTLVLPPLGTNLAWNVSNLPINGTITVVSTAAPAISSVVPLSDGNFRLNFSGPFGQDYEVRATTNISLMPITLWDLLDTDTFGNNPVIFDDLDATNHPQRFYQIRIP